MYSCAIFGVFFEKKSGYFQWMKKSASCKSPIREANISDREGTGMGQNVYRWSMCEKDKNIRNEPNRKKISKYVFLKIRFMLKYPYSTS